MKDSYDILDLPLTASQDEIRARYKQLVRIYHPDRFSNPLDKVYAERKLKEINEAYRVVTAAWAGHVQGDSTHAAPVLSVEPLVLDFGVLRPGERQVRRFQVDNHGGMAHSINFVCSEENGWFHVTNGHRVHQDRPLPLEFEVVADLSVPVRARHYGGWIEINMDGLKKRIALSARVEEPVAWRALPRLGLVLALCLAVLAATYAVRSMPTHNDLIDALWLSPPAPSSDAVWASASPEDEETSFILRAQDVPFASGAGAQPPAPPDENPRAGAEEGVAPQRAVAASVALTGPISSTTMLRSTPLETPAATIFPLPTATVSATISGQLATSTTPIAPETATAASIPAAMPQTVRALVAMARAALAEVLAGSGAAITTTSPSSLEGVLAITATSMISPTSTITPTALPTNTPGATETPEPTRTATQTASPTSTATLHPTSTATATHTETPAPTATSTATLRPTNTATATDTATLLPTNTATATDTSTPRPTNTATATDTATPRPTDTATLAPTATATSTSTPRPTNTATATDTATPRPTDTATPAPTATATSTATPQPTHTNTSTPLPTWTATPLPTETGTPAPTWTATPSPSSTATDTVVPPGAPVPITVAGPYRVNVRAETSVESAILAKLEVGQVVPAIARTVDNSWLRIVLPDGRLGWVFRETVGAPVEQIANLPVIYTE